VFQYDESNAFTNDGVQLTPNFDAGGEFVNYTLNGSEFTGDVNQLRANNQTLVGGDIFWEDINGDFVITNDDRQTIGNGNRNRPNSFFITDGSFVKLRFVRLGYDLPRSVMDKMNIFKKCSFFISGNNLLTWTNYPGFNPELGTRGNPLQPGVDNLRFPNDREVILGMNLKF